MELIEAMRSMPTARSFGTEPVPDETLRRALDSARFAPSGGNRQPWRVIAVRDRHMRRSLRDLYQPHWRTYMERTGGAAMLADPDRFDPRRVRMLRRADAFAERLHEVPLHLVICAHLPDLAIVDAGLQRQSIVGGASVYPFVQNLLLALRGEGLGAALTTLLAPAEPEVRSLLEIPQDAILAAYVLVGPPAEPWPKRLTRRPVEEFAFSERYGRPLG
jgi:nitroreductase